MSLNYTLVRDNDGNEQVSLFIPGRRDPLVADRSHPAWKQIKAAILEDDPDVQELFNLAVMLKNRLTLSERISTDRNHLYLDGDRVDDSLGEHIVKTLNEHWDASDLQDRLQPLLALLENIAENPSAHSRQQLYNYIRRHHVTTTDRGYLVLYKYVHHADGRSTDADKPYRSGNSGPAIVNGLPVNGYVGQDIGDVVEMPRSQVTDDPGTACASGLHVGAWEYVARNGSIRLAIYVHPRDVVSVPRDSNEQKIRVCRYRIIRVIDKPYDESLIPHEDVTPKVALVPEAPQGSDEDGLTEETFAQFKATAKSQRKGIKAFMERKGFYLADGDDGSEASHWVKAA